MDEDSDATEDPDQAADRLEAALERIAVLAQVRRTAAPTAGAADPLLTQVATDLDTLIARLRAELMPRSD